MIILIGAESLTGKTLMAQKLLEIYKIPYLSVDHLKMGLYRADNNCGFIPTDSNEAIEKHLWPILREIIKTAIENRQSMIIEGCYIFPGRLSEFSCEYRAHIIPVFMGFSKEYLEREFNSDIATYRSVIELREAEGRDVAWFIEANAKYKAMCGESGVRYFEIKDDYQKETGAIYEWIKTEAERITKINREGYP